MALQQSTQATRPSALEFGVDTVYERTNIVRRTGDNDGADGRKRSDYWEYEEKTYTYPEYVLQQHNQINDLMLAQVELANLIVGGESNG